MSTALQSYAEYARLIFTLLADRATVESHKVPTPITSTFPLTSSTIAFRLPI
jgi:hypothetical protein